MEEYGVMRMQEYGCVTLKLRQVMEERGISRNRLARLINTRYEVIDKWYKGSVEKLDLDILARLCFVLHCQVGELLEYGDAPAGGQGLGAAGV